MRKVSLSIITVSLLGLVFVGCGDSSDTQDEVVSKDVTVERAPVLNATVTDANGQVATQKVGQDIYSFAQAITFPVTVVGGFIDLNGNGVADSTDISLDIPLKSYSNIVTPITTLVAVEDPVKREELTQVLLAKLNVNDSTLSEDDLLGLSSKNQYVSALSNSIYEEVAKERFSGNLVADINSRFNYEDMINQYSTDMSELSDTLSNTISIIQNNQGKTLLEIESDLMHDSGYFNNLTASDIDKFQGIIENQNDDNGDIVNPYNIDIAKYTVAIYKNIDEESYFAHSMFGSTEGMSQYSGGIFDNPSFSCEDLGYTNSEKDYDQNVNATMQADGSLLIDGSNTGDIFMYHFKTYTKYYADSTFSVCNEMDYAGGYNHSGTNNIATAFDYESYYSGVE
jgi:hypothetical protein